MKNRDLTFDCLECFKTLSVKTRFRIFKALRDGRRPLNISQLTKMTALTQPTVTFHVNILQKAGLVKKEHSGRDVYCSVENKCGKCQLFLH